MEKSNKQVRIGKISGFGLLLLGTIAFDAELRTIKVSIGISSIRHPMKRILGGFPLVQSTEKNCKGKDP
jgi:hypothetical protein